MNNISNNLSTNKFEAFTGTLNIAPVKLSGTYKIFIDKNLKLFLDDYNGRRVEIDKSQKFLSQVSNFLKTNTVLNDTLKLKYGGFRSDSELSYHIPLYINNIETLPKYFHLSRVENKTISDSKNLHKFNDIIKIVDLKQIGLYKIFEEIIAHYDYIVNFNLEDSNLTINGYSLMEETNVKKTISILNNQSNQPYLDVLNNKILNTFQNNNIIFPKFINVEFEFQYENNFRPFNNFFGYLSVGKKINKVDFVDTISTVSLSTFKNKIVYKQEKLIDKIVTIPFIDIISISMAKKPTNRIPQIRLKINNIASGDYFKIIHPDTSVYFNYDVIQSDIKPTIRETLRFICDKLTKLTGRNLLFTSDINTNIVTIKSNLSDSLIEEYQIEKLNNYVLVDKTNKFCGIEDTDIIVSILNDENNYQSVLINNVYYDVIKSFLFEGNLILRLKDFDNRIIEINNFVEIFENKVADLFQLIPIPYLSVNSKLTAYKQYDKTKYVENLNTLFPTNEVGLIAQNTFGTKNNFTDIEAYVGDENKVLVQKNEIDWDSANNNINILSMMFCTPGSTAFLTPNILNIDKRFYNSNGNLDYKLLDTDKLKFHWFLIKAQTPEYLKEDIRGMRYFTENPKITSRLIISEDNLDFCETIFLGVKYRLPQKYKNYQFATYLDFTNEENLTLRYNFKIDNLKKTIYLVINKYLDFVDLIKGGEIENEPLIDLSFFYCVQESHNTNSESLYAFKTGGILLCDNEITVMYQNQIIKHWRIFDNITNKWYICLKRSLDVITPPLLELFPNSGNIDFYVYSSVVYNRIEYNYTSMLFSVKNIREVKDDYLWCEDVEVKFFDTPKFFVNIYNPQVINKIIRVEKENIISSVPVNPSGYYGDLNVISTIIVDSAQRQFKLLNSDVPLSFKNNYFEITRQNNYDLDNNYSQVNDFFYFPEFRNNTWNYTDLTNQFELDSFDKTTPKSTISLFNRNQLWRVIQDILKFDVKFKHTTPQQTYNITHEFLLSQLNEYSSLVSIPIENPELLDDKFVSLSIIENDLNVVVWEIYPEILDTNFIKPIPKLNKINRYNSPYLPYLRLLDNELEFQRDINTNRYDVLFNIYDENFSGKGINATGNLSEVKGNIVSSLFCKNSDIEFTILYPTDDVDIIQQLKNIITLEEGIINNNNEKYISTINSNVDEYIKESYIKWLLFNTYELSSVKNELGQKIEFETVSEINYIVKLKPISFYNTRFKSAIFTFTRK